MASNKQVQHIWAQGESLTKRAQNSHCENNVLYSYYTPIAAIHTVNGYTFALITTNSYSVTTSGKHMPNSYDVAFDSYHVPMIGKNGGQNDDYDDLDKCHIVNGKYLLDQYNAALKTVENRRAGNVSEWDYNRVRDAHITLTKYNNHFTTNIESIPDLEFDIIKLRELRDKKDAKFNSPEQVAKREKAKQAREAARLEKAKNNIADWLSGEKRYLDDSYNLPTYMRVNGENVETSRGANFPIDHAVKAWSIVNACRRAGETWHTNGHKIHLGHFNIDYIDGEGNVKAGCHFVKFEQIEYVAKQLKLVA